ncbi:MAG: alanine--tRNA ligase [bacterium]
MTSKDLRQKYLDFFKAKNHALLPSAPLIPENDPTVLFTTAGMHPLVPYLLGEKHPLGKRLASVQKCIRTSDIAEVGDDWHLTFFEMLGNWSLGDYWKKESIDYSWEFLTDKKWLGLDPNLLAVTVFAGDNDAPFDQEAYNLWLKKMPAERIAKLGKEDNWWGPAGKTGPCGPDTEIFYWSGDRNMAPKQYDPQDKRWVEIWNNVFMEYNKVSEKKFEPLKQKNVDTGLGLERTIANLSGQNNVYDTDLFKDIIKEINRQAGQLNKKDIRIIADHLRAAVFLTAEGIVPSNLEQGYVLRRLIRTAIVKGIKDIGQVAEVVIDYYGDFYDELVKNKKQIVNSLKEEQEKFVKTLDKAMKEYQKLKTEKAISGTDAFILFATYGLPFEVIQSLAQEDGLKVDVKGFKEELTKHQEMSRTATAGKFKSGLADNSEIVTRLHTAAHLLLQALRETLGKDIMQKGSNITAERLRLDFNFPRKLTEEELKTVEDLVNEKIKDKLEVICNEMSPEEAKKQGALGAFGHKYGDIIKVYQVGDFSKEICAGPHVKNTGELKSFKIIKEESSSSGIRRIKAVVG